MMTTQDIRQAAFSVLVKVYHACSSMRVEETAVRASMMQSSSGCIPPEILVATSRAPKHIRAFMTSMLYQRDRSVDVHYYQRLAC